MEVKNWTPGRMRSSVKPNSVSTTCSLHGCHDEARTEEVQYLRTPARAHLSNYRDQASMPDVKPDYFGSSYSKQRNLRRSSKEHLRLTPTRQSQPTELAERAEYVLQTTSKTIEKAMEVIDRSAAIERRLQGRDQPGPERHIPRSTSKETIHKKTRFSIPEEIEMRGNRKVREVSTEVVVEESIPEEELRYKYVETTEQRFDNRGRDVRGNIRRKLEEETPVEQERHYYMTRSPHKRQQVHTGTLHTELRGSDKKLTDFARVSKYANDSKVMADDSILPSRSDPRAHINLMVSRDTIDRLTHSIMKRPIDLSSMVSIRQAKKNPSTVKTTTFSLFKTGSALNRKDSKAEKDSEYKKIYLSQSSPSKPEVYSETVVVETREIPPVNQESDREMVSEERHTSYHISRDQHRNSQKDYNTYVKPSAASTATFESRRPAELPPSHLNQSSVIRRASRWDPSSVAESVKIADNDRIEVEVSLDNTRQVDSNVVKTSVVNENGDLLWRGLVSSERTREEKTKGRDRVELEMSELRKKYLPVEQGSVNRLGLSNNSKSVTEIARERSVQRQRSKERLTDGSRLNQTFDVLQDTPADCERISNSSYQPKFSSSKAKGIDFSVRERSTNRIGASKPIPPQNDPFEELRSNSNIKYKAEIEKKLNFDSAAKNLDPNSFSFQNATPTKQDRRSTAIPPTTAGNTIRAQDEVISFGNVSSKNQVSSRPGSSFEGRPGTGTTQVERDIFSEEKILASPAKRRQIDVAWRDERERSIKSIKVETPESLKKFSPRQALPVREPLFRADMIDSGKWCKYHGKHDVITESFMSKLNEGPARRATPDRTEKCTIRGMSNQSQKSFNSKVLGRHYKSLARVEGGQENLNRSSDLLYRSRDRESPVNMSYDDVKIVIFDEEKKNRDAKQYGNQMVQGLKREINEAAMPAERIHLERASKSRLSMHNPKRALKSCLKPTPQSKMRNFNLEDPMRSTLKY